MSSYAQLISNLFFVDAHTVEDVRYNWKTGKHDGIEVVSGNIAQFELLQVKKDSGAKSNSKGT